jgi:hypothetical protein
MGLDLMARCNHKWIEIKRECEPTMLMDYQLNWCQLCGTLRGKDHWGITAFEPDSKPRWAYNRPKNLSI